MADAPRGGAGGEARGRGRGEFGGRGRGRGRGGGRGGGPGGRGPRGKDGKDGKDWVPVTRLGRWVKENKIKTLEEIYRMSLPIKEAEIIDHFLGPSLKDEVLKIMPVQKQTRAGQRTRFKAFVAVGDGNGHVGFGVKCSKEVATAIRGAITLAKLSVVPVRRGYWGNKIGKPHTVPCKVSLLLNLNLTIYRQIGYTTIGPRDLDGYYLQSINLGLQRRSCCAKLYSFVENQRVIPP